MTIANLDQMSDIQVLTQYILEVRGMGVSLSHDEYMMATMWLQKAGELDLLIGLLADVLPKFYETKTTLGRQKSLKSIHPKLMKKIEDHKKFHS